MTDKYQIDGDEICCANCDVTLREFEENYSADAQGHQWIISPVWYCSSECYEEKTRNEG